VRAKLACCALLFSACGGVVAEDRTAEPLPSEFAFEHMSVFLNGSGELAGGDTPSFTARFETGSGSGTGGLYPVQYGIGYFFPTAGRLRIDVAECTAQDQGFFDALCVARLAEWNLTVTSRADHPHAFMDEATFVLEQPITGTAYRSVLDGSYTLSVEAVTLYAETRTGASSSRYEGALDAVLGETFQLRADMVK
jgi:hypothetical protein